jgi:hypothetical protein
MPSSIVSFEEFDRRLQAARSTVERLVAECPEVNLLVGVQRQLAAVHSWTRGGRKLEQGEKDSINFGLIASRFLSEIDEALTGELCELNSYITYWE